MRIALVAPDIPDYAIEYARILAETCDVLLQIPVEFRRADAFPPSSRLKIDWMPWPRQRSVITVFFIWKLARRIRRWRPDVIHCLDGNNIWLSLLAMLVKPAPFVTTIHDIHVHPGDSDTNKVPRAFVKALVKRSAAIIVHGEKLKADAANALPIPLDRIFVFPHPPLRRYVGIAKQNGFKKPSNHAFRVLFFGRIYEYKGLQYLIEAAPLVHDKIPQAKFVIAGRGEDLTKYGALSSDYFDVQNRFIPDVDAARMFTEADLLVLPYIEGSQSGVLMIALCFNLPVVATDIGEIANVVRKKKMGIIVPTHNSAALAAAIIEMAAKPMLRNSYRSAMNEALQQDFSAGSLSLRARDIYRLVLRTSVGPK
jgi:glycosyltransferase involved in cell wall biosynthesis